MTKWKLPSSRIEVELPEAVLALAGQFSSEMMDKGELSHLAACLAISPWSGTEIVVEIGTYLGSTAAFLAKTLRLLGREGCKILNIDPFERMAQEESNARGSYQKYLETINQHQVEDICLPLIALSGQAASVVAERIGLLIVDGSHLYPGVMADLQLYAPKVVPGGIVFIDDYIPAYPGVQQAIDEFFTPDQPWSMLSKIYFVAMRRDF
jgi:cephalosporin hydroxylase